MSKFYFDRKVKRVLKNPAPSLMQELLYKTKAGNCLLENVLAKQSFSKVSSAVMNTYLSTLFINGFVKRNGIDMSDFKKQTYLSFNKFFTRKIKPECRPVCMDENALISPCDGKALIYDINDDTEVSIKGNTYSVYDIVRDREVADEYAGGKCVVLRLSVDDYHRYCFIDDSELTSSIIIPGKLHTVNDISAKRYRIYKENSRQISTLASKRLGDYLQIEVGALMVGKIVNNYDIEKITRGLEKGYFCFGGSTIVLMFKKGTVEFDGDIKHFSGKDIEVKVKYGSKIGTIIK